MCSLLTHGCACQIVSCTLLVDTAACAAATQLVVPVPCTPLIEYCFFLLPCSFWFHGDDDPVERLRLLDTYLNEFEPKKVGGHKRGG